MMSSHQDDMPLLNVAVIGKSGTGKSTFINAYFGLPHTEDYAAMTDVVECTQITTPYYLPGCDVVLWDVPGFGIQRCQDDADYIHKINLKNFDFYLLLSCNKTDEYELLLHNEIAKQGKRYFYIRTKFYTELKNDKRANGASFSEENTRNKIRKEITDTFPDVPVYFVDSLKPDMYDFPSLKLLVKEGTLFSKSSHRDVQRKGEYMVEVRNNHRCPVTERKKCIIQ
ncbi:interferon-inducible GTPase 5-like [Gigantopelta aegis]|uniref:interferon-inducible GTPase 5-like n=1 Tax=Gigantopelta aegis TaxID=1735272 RepID=UPI001B88D8B4|nr:interferon-inducible GTPase 5-like [Gigantopelta aegis]